MKKIPLSQGQFALVDDKDFEYLSQWKWFLGCGGYASRKYRCEKTKKRLNILMHRVINKTPHNMHTDHVNSDKLDNRRANIRTATRKQNMQNTKKKAGSSIYKGVSWYKAGKKWSAKINPDRKRLHLGYFHSETEAALAYNKAAIKYFGQFAKLNIL